MKTKTISIRIVFFICAVLLSGSLFITNPFLSFAEQTRKTNPIDSATPSLIESIRFSEPIFFCGNIVLVDQQDIKERLEKEILLALWDRPQVILWIKRASKFLLILHNILCCYDFKNISLGLFRKI
ncbi:MAG: hypothetical protein GY701_05465 [Sulfitobacter sp.]|nr:hypothetical protein [Sulfitobacter sp.]